MTGRRRAPRPSARTKAVRAAYLRAYNTPGSKLTRGQAAQLQRREATPAGRRRWFQS